jgi:hypothetical protein
MKKKIVIVNQMEDYGRIKINVGSLYVSAWMGDNNEDVIFDWKGGF